MKVSLIKMTAFSLLFFNSCQDKKDESVSETPLSEETEIMVLEEEKPEDQLFANFESQSNMKNWISHYQNQGADLNLSQFNLQESQKLKQMPGNVKAIFDSDFDKTYEAFLIYNPSKTMYLDIDSYNWETDKEGNAMFNSDTEINLVNLKDKSVNRVVYYGASYWIDDAFWVTDSIFALLENNYDNQPSIQIFNLKKNTISPYVYSDTLTQIKQRSYFKKRLKDKGIKVSD
jgi:hypothetical protein